MPYKKLKVKLIETSGFKGSLVAMRNPKKTPNDSVFSSNGGVILGDGDKDLASRLIRAGNDHGKFARGIVVHFEMESQIGWLIEFKTYRIGMEDLSTSSTMHGNLKQFEGIQLAEKKQEDLPNLVYKTGMMASYQALRSIYRARRLHRHPDWRRFCLFIERLPLFKDLIFPEFDKDKSVKQF